MVSICETIAVLSEHVSESLCVTVTVVRVCTHTSVCEAVVQVSMWEAVT